MWSWLLQRQETYTHNKTSDPGRHTGFSWIEVLCFELILQLIHMQGDWSCPTIMAKKTSSDDGRAKITLLNIQHHFFRWIYPYSNDSGCTVHVRIQLEIATQNRWYKYKTYVCIRWPLPLMEPSRPCFSIRAKHNSVIRIKKIKKSTRSVLTDRLRYMYVWLACPFSIPTFALIMGPSLRGEKSLFFISFSFIDFRRGRSTE